MVSCDVVCALNVWYHGTSSALIYYGEGLSPCVCDRLVQNIIGRITHVTLTSVRQRERTARHLRAHKWEIAVLGATKCASIYIWHEKQCSERLSSAASGRNRGD